MKQTKLERLEADLKQAKADRSLAQMQLAHHQADVRSGRNGAQELERAAFARMRLLDGTIHQLLWDLDRARLEERDRRIAADEKKRLADSERQAQSERELCVRQQAEIHMRNAERVWPDMVDLRRKAQKAVADLPPSERAQYKMRLQALS
jgi:hypothetical protein